MLSSIVSSNHSLVSYGLMPSRKHAGVLIMVQQMTRVRMQKGLE